MTSILERVESARLGKNPAVICRLPSGWAVLSDTQHLRGYSILLPDPIADSLNDLNLAARQSFLSDMATIGDALLEVTDAFRINYAILGNSDPFLHAHIVPRYSTEPDAIRRHLPWSYPQEVLESNPFVYERDKELMVALAAAIAKRF